MNIYMNIYMNDNGNVARDEEYIYVYRQSYFSICGTEHNRNNKIKLIIHNVLQQQYINILKIAT